MNELLRKRSGARWCLLFWLMLTGFAYADEIRPAYLQITQTSAAQFDVFFKVPARGESERLNLDVTFGEGVTVVSPSAAGFDGGSHNQIFSIASPKQLQGTTISIDGLAKTNTEVLLRIAYLDGGSVVHRFTPDQTHYQVEAQASWQQIIATYFALGVEHIWFGVDHLLFVLVLLMLVPGFKKLISTITAFTIAHSITLILASLNWLRVPVPPVEACIALSIVFVASEIIHTQQGRPGLTVRKPWLVAFTFGLLHGLGFAAALAEIGLPQSAVLPALLVFNLGVEVGQVVFVLAVLAIGYGLKPLLQRLPTFAVRIPPYVIGGLAAFWVFERVYAFW